MIARSILYCCLKEGLSQATREASHPADRGLQLYPPLTLLFVGQKNPKIQKMSKKQGRFWKQLLLTLCLESSLACFIIVHTEKLRPPEGREWTQDP